LVRSRLDELRVACRAARSGAPYYLRVAAETRSSDSHLVRTTLRYLRSVYVRKRFGDSSVVNRRVALAFFELLSLVREPRDGRIERSISFLGLGSKETRHSRRPRPEDRHHFVAFGTEVVTAAGIIDQSPWVCQDCEPENSQCARACYPPATSHGICASPDEVMAAVWIQYYDEPKATHSARGRGAPRRDWSWAPRAVALLRAGETTDPARRPIALALRPRVAIASKLLEEGYEVSSADVGALTSLFAPPLTPEL